MTQIDRYYTPDHIASKMLESVSINECIYVADFAAGNGKLLKAAKKCWPDATFIANDLCIETSEALSEDEPDWITTCYDFLHGNTKGSKNDLSEYLGNISLILST